MGDSEYTKLSLPLYSESAPKANTGKRAAAKWIVGISGLAIFGYVMSTTYFSSPEASVINLNSSEPRLQEVVNNQHLELASSPLEAASFLKASGSKNSLALSKDNSLIAHADPQNIISVYDTKTEELLSQYNHNGKPILAFDITKDKKYLLSIAAGDKFIQVWDLATKAQYGQIEVEDFPSALLVTSDGEFAITRTERSVTVWNIKNLSASYSFDKYYGIFNDLALTPDGKYLAIGYYAGWIKVFEMSTKNEISSIYTGAMVERVQISYDGKTVASMNFVNKTAKVWSVETGKLIDMHQSREGVYNFGLSPDGRKVFITTYDRKSVVYNLDTKVVLNLQGDFAYAFFFTKDSKFIYYSDEKSVRSVELETYIELGKYSYDQKVDEIYESEDSSHICVLTGDTFYFTEKFNLASIINH